MQEFQKLYPGCCYHIYNRGVNKSSIFLEPENYRHFLILYSKYIDPIFDTYAWCLMPNHFHFLIKVWDPDRVPYPYKKGIDPSRALSHLFNAYAQSFNKRYGRTGKLFETPFKRKYIDSSEYFKQLIFYIHNNPVKHGFADTLLDYPWTSYQTIISVRGENMAYPGLTGWFNSKSEFVEFHRSSKPVHMSDEITLEKDI